ncbi:MAG TPA: hypothetical protein VJJ23_05045 [Candidatus Nanoarchaeia archaeon]|nr:hypothetical protein [Candidatus Nanoarchaeia archaeon]
MNLLNIDDIMTHEEIKRYKKSMKELEKGETTSPSTLKKELRILNKK